jgi:hypothetical protein
MTPIAQDPFDQQLIDAVTTSPADSLARVPRWTRLAESRLVRFLFIGQRLARTPASAAIRALDCQITWPTCVVHQSS